MDALTWTRQYLAEGGWNLGYDSHPSTNLTVTDSRMDYAGSAQGDDIIQGQALWTGKTVAYADNPGTDVVHIEPLQELERGWANVYAFCPSKPKSVQIDPTGIVRQNEHWWIFDACNPYAGPVASGIWSSGTITVPMTGLTAATPVGWASSPAHPTQDGYGAFVLRTQADFWCAPYIGSPTRSRPRLIQTAFPQRCRHAHPFGGGRCLRSAKKSLDLRTKVDLW